MKIPIVGSIKIDSLSRKRLFINNLESLKTVSDLFIWNFNIVGKYAKECADEVKKRYGQVVITNDTMAPYYQVVKAQLSLPDTGTGDQILFFLQEDHWFICPHKNLFLYLLDEFKKSEARVLRITHLTEFWKKESAFTLLSENKLYKEYEINTAGYAKMVDIDPAGYTTSLPGIFKKSTADDFLEHNKELLMQQKGSVNFELYGKKAEEFLQKKSIITMVPTFHVLREVFLVNEFERSMDVKRARAIIALRDNPDKKLGQWRRVTNLVFSPRVAMGIIKQNIKKLVK